MSEVRAFLAIELPGDLRDELVDLCAKLEPALGSSARPRFAAGDGLHLTIKFLGLVSTGALPKLVNQVAGKLARHAPFTAHLCGLGAFPNARGARVLWAGVREGASELARIARKIEGPAARAGAKRDHRPFHPHLTLARFPEPTALALDRLPAPEERDFPVEEVVLFESRLSSSGATYRPLARIPLGLAGEDGPGDESIDLALDL